MAKANTVYKYGRFLNFHPHGGRVIVPQDGRFAS